MAQVINLYNVTCICATISTIGRISEEESLFFYDNPEGRKKRQTYEDFQNIEFVPIFLDELNFTADQIAVCEGSAPCLFDLAVTADMEFAGNTKETEKAANTTINILCKQLT